MKNKKLIASLLISGLMLTAVGCGNTTTEASASKDIPEKVTETSSVEFFENGETEETHIKINENSIFINIDAAIDMTMTDIVNNIWKTTDVYVGMNKDIYAENFVLEDVHIVNETDTGWEFVADKSNTYISSIDLNVQIDANKTIVNLNEESYVTVKVFASEDSMRYNMFNSIVQEFKSNGYITETITDASDENKVVKITGNDRNFKVSIEDKFIIITIPIILEKSDDNINVDDIIISENGTMETILNVVDTAVTDEGIKPTGKPDTKNTEHPVKKG